MAMVRCPCPLNHSGQIKSGGNSSIRVLQITPVNAYISCKCQAPFGRNIDHSCVLEINFKIRLAFAFCNWDVSASVTEGCTTGEEQQLRTDIQ